MMSLKFSFILGLLLVFAGNNDAIPQEKWMPVGSGLRGFPESPSYVTSMVSFNGRFFATGFFTTAGDVTANSIAGCKGSPCNPAPPGLMRAEVRWPPSNTNQRVSV